MPKIISFSNQKGGVSKTTSSVVLGYGLVSKGFEVLLIDLDPQGNLTDFVGVKPSSNHSIFEVLKKEVSINDVISSINGIDVITANQSLSTADLDLNSIGKEYRLKEALASLEKEYDYIILDLPPAINTITINAFTACDEVIIPTTANVFSVSGIATLYENISMIQKYTNPRLKIKGVLITKFNPRTVIGREFQDIITTLSHQLNINVFRTNIRHSVLVEEAQANQKNLLSLSKKRHVVQDYHDFIDEYLSKGNNYEQEN